MDDDEADISNIVQLNPQESGPRTYETTIIANSRRYSPQTCEHKGPFIVDRKLGSVECRDCGAQLNPIYVLELLAAHETYWNMRQRELSKYLAEINKEIEDRTRTRCTHCGNMTAIRFKKEMPKTWFPQPF
jgi:hypothetical protein